MSGAADVAWALNESAEQLKGAIRALVDDAWSAVRMISGGYEVELDPKLMDAVTARAYAMAYLGASVATLRRRVTYGGRKGRRAARRLRAAGVAP